MIKSSQNNPPRFARWRINHLFLYNDRHSMIEDFEDTYFIWSNIYSIAGLYKLDKSDHDQFICSIAGNRNEKGKRSQKNQFDISIC